MNKKYDNLLFDLDGTLVDSYQGIANALDKVSERFGVELPREIYRKFIGPPLSESFPKYMPEIDADDALRIFREYYLHKGKYEYRLFDGVQDMLSGLVDSGYRIYVATSKREGPAVEVLKHAGVEQYFTDIFGAGLNERKQKYEVLEYGIEKASLDKRRSVLIGDTMFDVEGAESAGIDCVAVGYGFGDNVELAASSALAVLDSASDVLKYFG